MRKITLILIFTLSFGMILNIYGMSKGTKRCVDRPATKENAGAILDWCNDVSCWECWDYSVPGVIIHTRGCEANC